MMLISHDRRIYEASRKGIIEDFGRKSCLGTADKCHGGLTQGYCFGILDSALVIFSVQAEIEATSSIADVEE
jgi:hypothetical protein